LGALAAMRSQIIMDRRYLMNVQLHYYHGPLELVLSLLSLGSFARCG